jgi:hypothetical protein
MSPKNPNLLHEEFEARLGQLKQKLHDGELSWKEYSRACKKVIDDVESRALFVEEKTS